MTQQSRFPYIDGLRAISILWLVGFHILWFLAFFIPQESFFKIVSSGLISYVFIKGSLGVEIFFVLSGFLITHVLILDWKNHKQVALKTFYRRRIYRILPAYFICAVIYIGFTQFYPFSANLGKLWANLVFVNNYLPVMDQSIPWTWSLAIEEQFYLVMPVLFILLKGSLRKFAGLVAGLLLLAIGLRYFIVIETGPWLRVPVNPIYDGEFFGKYFDTLYSPSHMRIGAIFFGILARLFVAHKKTVKWIQGHAGFAHSVGIVCGGVILYVIFGSLIFSKLTGSSEIFYKNFSTAFDRYLYAGALAFLIFSAVTFEKPSRLQKFFEHKSWRIWAELSYSAFLLNPIVIVAFAFIFKEKLIQPTLASFVSYVSLSFISIFLISWLVYKYIEVPFRKRGRAKIF